MNYEASAIITNYSRPDNVKKIIACLRGQTSSVEIIIINNGDSEHRYDVELQIDSSKNLMCLPRWFACNYASAPYVFCLDDDLMFADDSVVADCIKYSKENRCAVGGFGVVLNGVNYWRSRHVKANVGESFEVDILKGRFIFTDKRFFKNAPLIVADAISYNAPRFEDDIFISSHIDKKIVPKFLANRLIELPEGEFSLCQQPDHRESRISATTKYFNKNESN
jgi:glycosyltransferase involved in cell wall biosynthesis